MTYNLAQLEKVYNVKLDSTQVDVLSNLINFVQDSKLNQITLCGYPGSGKTTLLKILYDIFSDNGFFTICVVPTNKAKSIFSEGQHIETIHSLLNLRPELDILEFNANKLQFDMFSSFTQTNYDVLIVDECSMINSSLYDLLLTKYSKSKIIFSGDPKQLACIEDGKLSKTFSNKCLHLTTVYRQSEGVVTKVINYLKNKHISLFKSVEDQQSSIRVYNNIIDMIKQYSYLFKLSKDLNTMDLTKLITFSNKRISALNTLIRSQLYSDSEEYHEGEILTAYDTYRQDGAILLENSTDYFIHGCKKCIINNYYPGYQLSVYNNRNCYITFNIISRKTPDWMLYKLSKELEILRLKACSSKNKRDWAKYFRLHESFATPIDLVYDGRIIKRKTIDYGYCISVYKSQGSGYQIAMIDMENINMYATGEKLRQLQYVACSRTKSDLIIYQKKDIKM